MTILSAQAAYEHCELCPRRCGIDRTRGQRGWCGSRATPRIARAALHQWEEPVISGNRGSGTVFFVGCTLGCVYCQNYDISHPTPQRDRLGRDVDVKRLAEICLELQTAGAHNINFVTPTHHAPHVVEAVVRARALGLTIPIVYNTSGYERIDVVAKLAGTVDVWLTDFKYLDAGLAQLHARADDYPTVAIDALAQMRDNLVTAGGRRVGADGTLRRGIIVRHLLLPGAVTNAEAVLDAIYESCGTSEVDISLMNQYTPTSIARRFGASLDRSVTLDEYERVLTYADDLDFEHIWWQEGGTVDESFIPSWDATGV